MDLSYQQTLVVIATLFTILISIITNIDNSFAKYVMLIVPPGILSALAYLSYQFRITAILCGHLTDLERKMNKRLGEDVHLWNSVYILKPIWRGII